MTIKQLSVFLENREGRLDEVLKTLGSLSVELRKEIGMESTEIKNIFLEKIIEKEEQIKKKMEELLRVKTEVMSVIDNIDNVNLRVVLKLRYIDSLSWSEIAEKIYASDKTVRRWHNQALELVVVPS